MRYLRTVQGCFAAIAVGVVLAACGSPASIPSNTASSTYLATARSAVVRLEFTDHNQVARGTISIAQLSNAKVVQRSTSLTGSLKGSHLDLRSSVSKHQAALVVDGTLKSNGVIGTLSGSSPTGDLHLNFQRSTSVLFKRAVDTFKDQVLENAKLTSAQHRLAEQAIANLKNEIVTLARDATALGVDAASLQVNLGTEVTDVASAKSDAQKAEGLLAASPPAPHSSLCRSVNVVRTDAENVANDGQFVAGFISGLQATERNVVTEASNVNNESIDVRRLTSSSAGLTAAALPPSSEITRALTQAGHSEKDARTDIGKVIGSVNSDQITVFRQLNSLVATTRCGEKVAAPHPLVALPG